MWPAIALASLTPVPVEMPHPAQVTFSFFSDIPDEHEHRTPSANPHVALPPPWPALPPRPRHCRRRRERTNAFPAGRLRSASRPEKLCRCAPTATRAGHKIPCAGHLAMALPTSSMYGFSSPSSRKRSHNHSARGSLAERRSRHRHHLRLPLQDSLLLQVQPLECLVHAAVSREPGDRCGCGRRRSHRSFQRSIQRRPRRAEGSAHRFHRF